MPLWRDYHPFQVRPSELHGRGVFAKFDLEGGWLFRAPAYEVIQKEEPEEKEEPEFVEEEISRSVFCDEREYELYNPYCFLNYSETPNAVLWCCEGRFEVELLRDVEQDEEITIDYF